MDLSFLSSFIDFFKISYAVLFPKVFIDIVEKTVSDNKIWMFKLDIFNNYGHKIKIKDIESDIIIKWYESPRIFILESSEPINLEEVESPYDFPVEIPNNDKKSIIIYFKTYNDNIIFKIKPKNFKLGNPIYTLQIK